MLNPSQEPPASYKAPNQDFKDMYVLCRIKIMIESKIWNIGLLKISDHIQIKIMMPNSSQAHPVFFKAQNQDFKDIDVL